MKTLFVLLLSACCSFGQAFTFADLSFMSPEPPTTSYVFYETFEGPGYVKTWTESVTNAGAVIDDQYSTAPLSGSYSLKLVLNNSNDGDLTSSETWTDLNECWIKFTYKCTGNSGQHQNPFFFGVSSSDALALNIGRLSTGVIRLVVGSVTMDTTTTSTLNETRYIWIYYKASTSNNGEAAIYISATNSKPESPEASTTIHTRTAEVGKIKIGNDNDSDFLIDDIIVDESAP